MFFKYTKSLQRKKYYKARVSPLEMKTIDGKTRQKQAFEINKVLKQKTWGNWLGYSGVWGNKTGVLVTPST